MGVKDLWTHALGLFKNKPHELLSKSKGLRIAIDVSVFMNKTNGREVTQLATTNEPPYPSPDVIEWLSRHHPMIVEAGVTPVYVFDGPAPEVKKLEKNHRAGLREKVGQEYRALLDKVKEDEEFVTVSDDELEKAIDSRKKMAHPTVLDHAAAINWLKERDVECVGSLFEADQQMRKLEMDGIVDGIATEDGDEIILGSKRIYLKHGQVLDQLDKQTT